MPTVNSQTLNLIRTKMFYFYVQGSIIYITPSLSLLATTIAINYSTIAATSQLSDSFIFLQLCLDLQQIFLQKALLATDGGIKLIHKIAWLEKIMVFVGFFVGSFFVTTYLQSHVNFLNILVLVFNVLNLGDGDLLLLLENLFQLQYFALQIFFVLFNMRHSIATFIQLAIEYTIRE